MVTRSQNTTMEREKARLNEEADCSRLTDVMEITRSEVVDGGLVCGQYGLDTG